MRIHIQNIGPLTDVELDLSKQLTVFTGQNRTGKTLASFASYGAFDRISNISFVDLLNNKAFRRKDGFVDQLKNLFSNNIYNIKELVNTASFYKNYIEPQLNFTIEKDELRSLLDSKRAVAKDSKIIYKSESNFEHYFDSMNQLEDSSFDLYPFLTEITRSIENDIDLDDDTFRFFMSFVSSRLFNEFRGLIYEYVFFLPAERNALNLYSHELVSSQFRRKLTSKVVAPPYALPVFKYIQFINNLRRIREDINVEDVADFPAQFLDPLIGGTLSISKEGELEYKSDKGEKVDYHLAASSVKSLSGLYVYLKHIAEPNNTIIFIDEPELNLHPSAQRLVARFIARMVNAGIKMVISTHSDYMIRQLNNLLILGGASDKAEVRDKFLQKYGYDAGELLTPEQVATYHFTLDRGVENLPVTEEGINYGIRVPEIDQVINDAEEETLTLIYNLLED